MSKKSIALVLGVVAVGAGAVYLYRRGRVQQSSTTVRGSVLDTIKSGAVATVAAIRASAPSSGGATTTAASTPTEASADPRRSKTGPAVKRSRQTSRALQPLETWRDAVAQGRYPTN